MKRKKFFFSICMIVLLSLAVSLTSSTAQTHQSPLQPQVELGEPGLSFAYSQTFGETGMPYVEDSDHLNYPWGIGSDGTNIWIGEVSSSRALKFTSDGTFLMQIGSSSFRALQNIFQVVDVGVDGAGNIWLVDAPAHHILKYDPSGSQIGELGQMWDCSSANDRFCNPRGISFDASGNIYVSESGNARIQIFDSAGIYLVTLGTGVAGPGNDQFDEPEHIAVYANQLYVADSLNQRIQIFDITSPITPTYVATIGETGVPGDDNDHFACPNGVSLDDAYIYIADACNNRIQIFDRSARIYFATLGSGPGQGDDEFDLPTDLVVDSTGNLYVADYNNTRVQQFDPTWEYARTYGSTRVPYLPDGHYNIPLVSTDAEDNILITEEWGHRLIKLNPDGNLQWSFGEAGVSGWDNEHLSSPMRVSADSSGNIYVPEAWNCRVQIISPDGEYVNTLGISCGSGADQINGPRGVAIGSNGLIYIADSENQRIQIFDISTPITPTLVATIGEFYDAPAQGCLSDNDHFCFPSSVVLDTAGNIFVADTDNHRVQKFNSDLDYQMTIGSGVQGNLFDQFSWPVDVVVDAPGNIYVSDAANNRVQVFDATGAYLTTIGGAWGTNSAQFISASSVAVDSEGNVYVSDQQNSRIQVFTSGVPDWKQVNINGFGIRGTEGVAALGEFNNSLYAGANNYSNSVFHIYRSTNAQDWEEISHDFDTGISSLEAFDDQLFAGTWSGSIWSSPDGLSWTQVMTSSLGIASFSQFNDVLFAGTYCNETEGATIWQTTDGMDWSPLVTNGNGDPNACGVISSAEFAGDFYFGVADWSGTTGGRIWRYDGTEITEVVGDGFGNPENRAPGGLAVLGDWLYASIYNPNSNQVWRSDSGDPGTWELVLEIGMDEPGFKDRTGLIVLEDHLFLTSQNDWSGMQVWRTGDGENWEQIGFAGFGDSNNIWSEWSSGIVVLDGRLYISTSNFANGAEIWLYQPEVTADFTAAPTTGIAPLEVTFTNTSTGTLTDNLWNFGDGETSTLTSPVHTYETPGVYAVTLTVESFGNTDSIVKPGFITVKYHQLFLPVVTR